MANATSRHSTLGTNTATFDSMIKRFGVVTVMNAKVYDCVYTNKSEALTAEKVAALYEAYEPLCTLDTLKIANISVEGPDKTVSGGQYSNPLIKFGKSARLEMQDALGNADALAYLGGGILEWGIGEKGKEKYKFHMGENFVGPKAIIGDSFFIEQSSGQQVPVKIIIYQMLPDSIFNLTQDAEGDATVFDLNGDLLATNVSIGYDNKGQQGYTKMGLFYSILNPQEVVHTALRSTGAPEEKADGTYVMATQIAVPDGKTFNTEATPVLYDLTTGRKITKGTTYDLFKNQVVNAKGTNVTIKNVNTETTKDTQFTKGNSLVVFGTLK